MSISVGKLLDKIEEELVEAKKFHSDARVRERVYAMKTMCELILEESSAVSHVEPTNVRSTATNMAAPTPAPVQSTTLVSQPKRIRMNDEANGDSIFDF
jgi:hypothetical protein